MLEGRRVLAVVPARAGSKGVPDKNLQPLGGVSLIGWAGRTLAALPWLDARVLSTDSPAYAEEGRRYGLAVPSLRPAALSADATPIVQVLQHVVRELERGIPPFDVILLVEPTSPLRTPEDVERTAHRLLATGAESVATVSPLPARYHPWKLLRMEDEGRLRIADPAGGSIVTRQQLPNGLYLRNGVCYAMTRTCLMDHGAIFTERTVAEIITRPVVNIDEPLDLAWAAWLAQQRPQNA